MPTQESPGGDVNPDAPVSLRLNIRDVVDILPQLRDIIQGLLSANGISGTEPLQYTPFIGDGTDANQPVLIIRLQEPVRGTISAWWVSSQRALRFEIHGLSDNFQAPHTTLVSVPHQTPLGTPWEPSQLTRPAQARSPFELSNTGLDWVPGKGWRPAAREGAGTPIAVADIHDRTLTPDEIQQLHADPLAIARSTLRDISGRGNHGTLTNMDPATDSAPSWRWEVPIPEADPTSETDLLDIRSMLEEEYGKTDVGTATEEPAQAPILPELARDEHTGKPFRVIEIDDT